MNSNVFYDIENGVWGLSICKNIDGIYIIIYTNDDEQIPHFHISDNVYPNETSFDISLKITSPEYLRHVNHQYRELDKNMLLKIYKILKNEWSYIIKTWNLNNSNQTISYDTPITDYMSLILE